MSSQRKCFFLLNRRSLDGEKTPKQFIIKEKRRRKKNVTIRKHGDSRSTPFLQDYNMKDFKSLFFTENCDSFLRIPKNEKRSLYRMRVIKETRREALDWSIIFFAINKGDLLFNKKRGVEIFLLSRRRLMTLLFLDWSRFRSLFQQTLLLFFC